LSLEGDTRWLTTTPVPPWITYARQILWQEPWFPSPRCLYGCEILAVTTRSHQTENPGTASRILYLLADERDGWHPVPPDGDEHGGELVTVASFKHARPADVFVPAVQAAELARWRARRSSIADYWAKFVRANPQATWPALTGVVTPAPPAPQRKGWFS
jgi:hypothetical protein